MGEVQIIQPVIDLNEVKSTVLVLVNFPAPKLSNLDVLDERSTTIYSEDIEISVL